MKKRYLLFGLFLLAVGTIIGRTILQPDPPEPVYLPADSVEVEVVPQNFLDKLAAAESLNWALDAENGKLKLRNGRLEDENGRLVEVSRRLSVDTGAVPEPEEITKILKSTCGSQVKREYKADMQAFEFRGLNEDGNLAYGWQGKIGCFMRVDDGTPRRDVHAPDWMPLVVKPFSLSHVEAQTTEAPEPVQRPSRWYLGLQAALLSDSQTLSYDYDHQSVFDYPKYRLYGGRILFPKKRHQIRAGVFAESGAAGVDLSFSW